MLQDMGNHTAAIRDFEKCIELDSTYAHAFYYIGLSRLRANQVKDAINDF